jgi:proteasome lid subunit RPN8/RPN11
MTDKSRGEGGEGVADLRLGPQAVAAIRRHVEDTYPEEACGGLLGLDEGGGHIRVPAALPIANTQRVERQRRYLINPADVMDLEQCARARGFEVLGYYHSHPDGPPLPSAYDREHAWPWYIYLIVSVSLGRVAGARAWRLAGEGEILEPVTFEWRD